MGFLDFLNQNNGSDSHSRTRRFRKCPTIEFDDILNFLENCAFPENAPIGFYVLDANDVLVGFSSFDCAFCLNEGFVFAIYEGGENVLSISSILHEFRKNTCPYALQILIRPAEYEKRLRLTHIVDIWFAYDNMNLPAIIVQSDTEIAHSYTDNTAGGFLN